jgi:hypothetical protein
MSIQVFKAINKEYQLILEYIRLFHPYYFIEKDGAWVNLYEEKERLEHELEVYFKEMEGSLLG